MHAAALYALAETQSGLFLQNTFSSHRETVVPLLRTSSVKYKHPARGTVYARAYADVSVLEAFEKTLSKKGRATITVQIELSDTDGQTVMVGEYGWFVQSIDQANILS
jgi:acyl-coenzyme A thioesterase PaaI-like protein